MNIKKIDSKNLIEAKIGDVLNTLFSQKMDKIDGYKKLKDLTPKVSKIGQRIGLYKNSKGEKVVLKSHKSKFLDLNSLYLQNEILLLSYLKRSHAKPAIYPRIQKIWKKNNQIILETKFINAKSIENLTQRLKIKVIKEALESLEKLSSGIGLNDYINLPRRMPYAYLLGFLVNLLKLILKKPSNYLIYLKYSQYFYLNYIPSIFQKVDLKFSHRDLQPDNIFYSKGKVTILDWESAAITDSLYDLSQIAIIYWKDFEGAELIQFLNGKLKSNYEKKRFISLSLFNSMQILSNNNSKSRIFKDTEKYIEYLMLEIKNAILSKKSPFEIIYGITLDLITVFYNLTGFNKFSTNKKLMLCYHSIGESGWRFAVKVDTFKKQLEFLKSHYKLITARELISKRSHGINLSFDDGYMDIFQNVLPVLRKENITPTLFVLGTPRRANRIAMDNNLELLNIKQIKKLKKIGWEIGYHTKTHSDLNKLNDDQLKEEIVEGKKEFEKALNFKLNYFAYPKGIYNKKIIKYVSDAGFKAAFTVDSSDINLKNKYRLDRIPVEGDLSLEQFESLLSPAGLFITKIFMKVLQTKENLQNLIKRSAKNNFQISYKERLA